VVTGAQQKETTAAKGFTTGEAQPRCCDLKPYPKDLKPSLKKDEV